MSARIRPAALAAAALLSVTLAGTAVAQDALEPMVKASPYGLIVTPRSSQPHPGGAHTNHHAIIRYGQTLGSTTPTGSGETPASLACVYGLVAMTNGCNPSLVKAVATGGIKTIAIVIAYDYTTAFNDLTVYSRQYGLPLPTTTSFKTVYAQGSQPPQDPYGSWAIEGAIDIEMAHALAPKANIILVEAFNIGTSYMLAAEQKAVSLVAAAGGGVVSNSWAWGEFSGESRNASSFTGNNVVVLAGSGDYAGPEFPASLANVIAVGGTTINRDSSGNYTNQTTWYSNSSSAGGGGLSTQITRPAFQNTVSTIVGKMRGTPDLSLVGNPGTGVWVYDSMPYNGVVQNWSVWGGTSVATPLAAAMVSAKGSTIATPAELTKIYAGLGNNTNAR